MSYIFYIFADSFHIWSMEKLKEMVINELGRTLESPADFAYLSEHIQNINKEHDFLTYQLRKAELQADSLQQKMKSMYDDYSKYRDNVRQKEQNEYFERFRW